jgi:hypothetical protein
MGQGWAPGHYFDTPVSGGLRFGVEVLAWVAGPWAAGQVDVWLIAPVVVVLVGLPAVFSTKGDKNKIVVATPGPVRAAIELFLHVVAVVGAWYAWPVAVAVVATVIVAAALVAGLPRMRWLLRSAPLG